MAKDLTAKRIKKLRNAYGMSQEKLAGSIHVTRSSVRCWESGQTYPSIDNCVALARLFHVSTDYLIAGDRNMSINLSGYTAEQQRLIQKLVCGIKEG